MTADIDIVITWVDGADPEWLAEKAKYQPGRRTNKAESDESRFRDWDTLKYVFRGIEKYMPWVRRVFLITCGQCPPWLNREHERLRLVFHKDYIPEEYLPTFNSNVIELNAFRIPDLAEKYIHFCDDFFVLQPTAPEDFFEGDAPRDAAILSPYRIRPNGISSIENNNLEIINKYFSVDDISRHKKKWLTPVYGKKMFRTLLFKRFSWIIGVMEPHTQLSLKKSTLKMLWEKEPEILDNTSRQRFRSKEDVSIALSRLWQIMSGDFVPRRWDFGASRLLPDGFDDVIRLIKDPGKTRLLCINDNVGISDFERMKRELQNAFEARFPEKSGFEL